MFKKNSESNDNKIFFEICEFICIKLHVMKYTQTHIKNIDHKWFKDKGKIIYCKHLLQPEWN